MEFCLQVSKSVEENAKDMLNEYEEETSTHEDISNAPKEIKKNKIQIRYNIEFVY